MSEKFTQEEFRIAEKSVMALASSKQAFNEFMSARRKNLPKAKVTKKAFKALRLNLIAEKEYQNAIEANLIE